jgi:hypothetical protein
MACAASRSTCRATATAAASSRDPVLVGHSISAVISMTYAASRPGRGVVDVDQPLNPRPFAELVQSIEPALRGDDFGAAFQRFQDGMRLDLLEEWPGRGHLGFVTEPDRYAARLRELALRGA